MREITKGQMLERIRQLGVSDRLVLGTISSVDRKLFVPDRWQSEAYADMPLTIGFGQTISQPYTVARMIELLISDARFHPGEAKVLEIGTGSGWQTAILAKLFREVYSVEIISRLAVQAQSKIKTLGINNIKFKTGDGKKGWSEYALYDAIICGADANKIPKAWITQLAVGGRIVSPVNGVMTRLLNKTGIKPVREKFGNYSFVPLV